MWTVVKAVVLRWILGRSFGGVLALLLAVLLPLGGLLKAVGLPLLLVLLVVGAPLFALLALVGLPVLLVAGAGVAILGVLLAVLTFGVVLIKVAIPIVLIVWFVRWAFGGGRDDRPSTAEPEAGAP